jgi:hypothetical protein
MTLSRLYDFFAYSEQNSHSTNADRKMTGPPTRIAR